MFDMGFTEMMLIGIVALVVIGPEKLPGVARTAGKYFARLRNFMTNVRADVESELKADELRELFEAQQKELESLKEVVGDVGKDIGLSEISNEVTGIAESIGDSGPAIDAEPKAKAKSAAKTEPAAKVAAKTKSAAKPKATAKSKPKAKSKTTIKKKAKSDWTSSIAPPGEENPAPKASAAKVKSKPVSSSKVKTPKVKAPKVKAK